MLSTKCKKSVPGQNSCILKTGTDVSGEIRNILWRLTIGTTNPAGRFSLIDRCAQFFSAGDVNLKVKMGQDDKGTDRECIVLSFEPASPVDGIAEPTCA